MQAYTGFAQVYDTFMDNVPYDDWVFYLTGLLQEYGVKDGLVLELGCGTGKVTRRMAAKGYDMIGIDISEEMLEIAREKEYGNDSESDKFGNSDLEILTDKDEPYMESDISDRETTKKQTGKMPILYLQQDMRDFELYGTISAVVSICDSMNYITSEEDLLKVFHLVNNYLDPGGLFIFDMNTEYKYKSLLADNTIAENREECSFIWENYYDEEKRINEYNMTIFVKIEDSEIEDGEIEDVKTKTESKLNEGKLPEVKLEKVGSGETDLDETDLPEDDSEEYDDSQEYEEEGIEYGKNDCNQLFARFQEIHYQKAYSIDKVKQLIEKAGMELITVYDAFTHCSPEDTSERVYFIAREKYQENKKYIQV